MQRLLTRRAVIALVVLGAVIVSAALASSQAASSAVLPDDLRASVQRDRFSIVTSIRGLPLGVRDALQRLFGSQSLDIAESGADLQVGGTDADSLLPARRLALAGCSYERCLVYYELGGAVRTWRVALFHWTPEATRFEWGGTAPGGLKTIDDVKRIVLAGTVKDPSGVW